MLQVTAAILSALLFNVSLVLQSIDARQTSSSLNFRLALLSHLIRRPLWTVGTVLVLVAYCLEVVALASLPIGFVQPVIAAGVLLLPPTAVLFLGEEVEVAVIAGASLIVLGVILLTVGGPQVAYPIPHASVVALGALSLTPVALFVAGRSIQQPLLSAGISGVCYAVTGVVTRLLALQGLGAGFPLLFPLCAAATVAFLAEMTALQNLPATRVGPVVLALNTTIPVVCGGLFLGERWVYPLPTIGSLVSIVVGAVFVLRFIPIGEPQSKREALPR